MEKLSTWWAGVLAAWAPWWAVSFLANLTIIGTEYVNRTSPTLLGAWGRSWPLMVLAQAFLWYSYNRAPHWFTAWLVFTFGNSVCRVAAIAFSGEPLKLHWAVAGAGLMALGSLCVKRAVS